MMRTIGLVLLSPLIVAGFLLRLAILLPFAVLVFLPMVIMHPHMFRKAPHLFRHVLLPRGPHGRHGMHGSMHGGWHGHAHGHGGSGHDGWQGHPHDHAHGWRHGHGNGLEQVTEPVRF